MTVGFIGQVDIVLAPEEFGLRLSGKVDIEVNEVIIDFLHSECGRCWQQVHKAVT